MPGAALAMGLLMLLGATGGIGAHPVPASTTISAPYHGSHVFADLHTATSCATGTVLQAAHFTLHSGIGGLSDSSSASWCSAGTRTGSVSIAGGAESEIGIGIAVGVSGVLSVHTITATWTVQDSWAQSLTAGTCTATASLSDCTQESFVNLTICGNLWDVTAGFIVNASSCSLSVVNYTLSYKSCSTNGCATSTFGGAGSGSGTSTGTVVVKALLSSAHKYVLDLFVNATTFVSFLTHHMTLGPTAAGQAAIDIRTASPSTDYAQLNSIVIS
ncbi:MAG: hypothetical protein L3K09_06675 [Thermoplasmata archaeon]|nr:hypothetical protein [Thermoplasmata archaeon]